MTFLNTPIVPPPHTQVLVIVVIEMEGKASFVFSSICSLETIYFVLQYAVESQLQLHGLNVEKSMVMVEPRKVCKG